MPKYPYRILGTFFDRLFRNDLNDNFKDVEVDLKEVQTKVNQLVVEGDSSPQAALASVNAKGVIKATLKQRLDDDYNEVATSLAENAKKIAGRRSITDWDNLVINKGQLNEDWKDAFQAARDFLNGSTIINQLVFPAGIYQYSVSPNWAIQDSQIISEGEVRLRYTGTDKSVILDGTIGTNGNVYNMKFGKFIIESPSTAKDGIYIDCIHHSEIDINVRGCGNGYSAIKLLFTVCNVFKFTVSGNEEGVWYSGTKPYYGLKTSKLFSGKIPSYNTFLNCIIEGTTEGALLDDTLGNIFVGGTIEGCADSGLTLTNLAGLNKFYGMDFEANVINDLTCNGFENQFFGVDSVKMVDFGATAKNNSLIGGSFKNITLESGSNGNLITAVNYNRELGDGITGQILDNGTRNRLVNNKNVKGNTIENRPSSAANVTVGASPFAYTNTSGNDERILLIGGTMSQVLLAHGASGDIITGIANQFITLCPGDTLTITYSVSPTMRKYTT